MGKTNINKISSKVRKRHEKENIELTNKEETSKTAEIKTDNLPDETEYLSPTNTTESPYEKKTAKLSDEEKARKKAERKSERIRRRSKAAADSLSTGNWYLTFMYMGIPIIGLIYMIVISVAGKSIIKRRFARAFILYQLTMFIITLLLMAFALKLAVPYAEWLLDYVEML